MNGNEDVRDRRTECSIGCKILGFAKHPETFIFNSNWLFDASDSNLWPCVKVRVYANAQRHYTAATDQTVAMFPYTYFLCAF